MKTRLCAAAVLAVMTTGPGFAQEAQPSSFWFRATPAAFGTTVAPDSSGTPPFQNHPNTGTGTAPNEGGGQPPFQTHPNTDVPDEGDGRPAFQTHG